MKRIINILFLMLLSTAALWGQSARPLQNVPTPEAAGLGMYGSIPVGLFTGIPNISVPLHEMKVGSYSFPISVNYHLASVKPNAQEGLLGLGWSLFTGGCINRTVRCISDEQMHSDGWASGYFAHHSKMKNITSTQFITETRNIQADDDHYYELSADEFSFSFGNYSGNFYLNENGEWDVISDHNIRVIFDENSGFLPVSQLRSNINTGGWGAKWRNQRFFNKFTLVTPDGCRYEFGGADATEYSIPYYARYNSDLIATTWYLTRITTPEGWNVDYVYEGSGPTCNINYAPSRRTLYNIEATNPHGTVRGRNALTGFLHFLVLLKEIRTPNETVSLKYGYGHLEPTHIQDEYLKWPYEANGYVDNLFAEYENPANQFHLFLDKTGTPIRDKFHYRNLYAMEIKSNFNLSNCKTYYFEYVYNTRRKLSLITERLGEYQEKTELVTGGGIGYIMHRTPDTPTHYTPKEYRFQYNTSNPMPSVGILKEDSWGYYNGGTVSISDAPTFLQVRPNLDYTQSEVLIEMEFPTKGKVQFEYELQEYSKIVSPSFNSLLNSSGNAGGLRISSIKTLSEDDQMLFTKKYYYTEDKSSTTSSGILRNKPVFGLTYHHTNFYLELYSINGFYKPITNMNSPDVGYSCVIEETLDSLGVSQGQIKHRYTNFDTDIWGEDHYDESAIYSMVSGENYISPCSSKSMERGKLVSEEYFDKNGRPKRSIKYQYEAISKERTRLLTANQYVLILNAVDYPYATLGDLTYTYLHSYLPVHSIETLYENGLELEKEQSFTYTSNKQIRSESVSNSQDNTFITANYRYVQDIVNDYPNLTSSSWLVYKQMVDKNILDRPIEVVKVKGDHVLSAVVNEYKLSGSKIVPHKTHTLETTTPILVSNSAFFSFSNLQTEPILDARMKLRTLYKEFDSYGNPLSINHQGTEYVYLWSYRGQYPIAEMENTTYQEVKTAIETKGLNLNSLSVSNTPDMRSINALRGVLGNAHITTYTYTPSIGITSITDPSGKVTCYEYDPLYRLKEIYTLKSGRKEILETYEYNYTREQFKVITPPMLD